jgi:hypothetical protein
MKVLRGTRARLGGALLALTAAVAMLALPGLASSHDKGGSPPGDAGVIQSFDPATGLLVVDLAEGDTASGLVVERTHIRCGKPPRGHHRRGPKGGSDDSAARRPGRGDEMPGPRDEGPGPGGNDEGNGENNQHGETGEDPPGHDGTPPGASEDPGQGAEHSSRCGTDDLTVGTVVKKAEIVLTNGNAYFRVICLPRPLPADTPEAPSDDS